MIAEFITAIVAAFLFAMAINITLAVIEMIIRSQTIINEFRNYPERYYSSHVCRCSYCEAKQK